MVAEGKQAAADAKADALTKAAETAAAARKEVAKEIAASNERVASKKYDTEMARVSVEKTRVAMEQKAADSSALCTMTAEIVKSTNMEWTMAWEVAKASYYSIGTPQQE